jgi:4-amino-4-deoxy-L-arabinose transferase-like glycosyltransferase
MKTPLNIWHLVMIFAVGVLPFAATFALPYPDERHYTDGALQMLRDHDWFVPKTPKDNSTEWLPRFHKPPLAYWAVAASFAALGPSVPAARLPFLLASCGTLLLTWRLARKLSGNNTTALLAAVILASHVQFIFAATRSIPDALLVFFVTLSAFGFLRLIVFEELVGGAFWMAYGGAAGAAMSKGLLGLGIALFAWAFAYMRERKLSAVKKLLHWPSLALAAALVGAWFGYIIHRYGMAAWNGFFGDQVSGNVHGAWWSLVWRAPVYGLVFAVNFLPWSLPALEAWLRGNWKWVSAEGLTDVEFQRARSRKFILAWSAVLAIGFALGTNVSVRYLLPATPLLAVLVADIVAGTVATPLTFSVRRIFKFMLGLLLLLALVAGIVNAQWDLNPLLIMTVALFGAGIVTLGLGALRRGWLTPNAGLGISILLVLPVLFFAVNRVLLPDPAEQLASTFRRARIDPTTPVLFVGRPALVSGVRLFLGGKCNLIRAERLDANEANRFVVALVPESQAGELARRGWELLPAATIAGAPPAREWWPVLKSRTLPDALEQHGGKYMLGLRN